MEGARTESERYFEEFCFRNKFQFLPVQVGAGKTPDYVLVQGATRVVIEVKEVLPTPEELESERLLSERGTGNAISKTPGERVRKKIGDASAQIKARTQGTYPGLLVLWERGFCCGTHTEPYHIRVAMEGFEQMVLAVPAGYDQSPEIVGMKYGGRRRMTANANTSISAVGVLCVPNRNEMLLQVFHNRHASVPLDPSLLSSPEVRHFVLRPASEGTTEWLEMR